MKERGFTLIEILIALAVFAIIASFTSYILAHSFDIDKRLKIQGQRNHQLELALLLLRRETQQIINRPIRGNEQSLFPALIGHADGVEFTRGGDINLNAAAQRSNLKRVAYLCDGHKLIRRTWPLLDTPDRRQFHSQVLLDHLSDCGFTYRDERRQSYPEWKMRPENNSKKTAPLPTSIVCHLTLEKSGTLTMVLPLVAGFYA